MESVSPRIQHTAAESEADSEPQQTPKPRVYPRPIPLHRIDPDAVKVLRRLSHGEHTAYLVGGGVRDLLLGRAPKDFDIATSARPQEVKRLFRNCRIIGRRFRLAHILFSRGKVIEVATFRRDPRFDGQPRARTSDSSTAAVGDNGVPIPLSPKPDRWPLQDLLIHHDNVFGLPHEDAARRDFTINGLFYDIERQEVIDYVQGMDDLRSGVVRTIGEPAVRFREDPVRLLRAIKFSARLDMGIDPEVYDAMVAQRHGLNRCSRPRVLEELLRLLRGGAAHRSIYLMWDVGVLGVVLPELTAFLEDEAAGASLLWGRLSAIDERVRAGEPPSDAVLLAALLWGTIAEALECVPQPPTAFESFFTELSERLAVPRRIKDRIRLIAFSQDRLKAGQVERLARRDFFPDAATFYGLQCSAGGQQAPDWADRPEQRQGPSRVRSPRRTRRRSQR